MGKGKGAVDHYVAVVRPVWFCSKWPGPKKRWRASAAAAAFKLPISARIIKRTDPISGGSLV